MTAAPIYVVVSPVERILAMYRTNYAAKQRVSLEKFHNGTECKVVEYGPIPTHGKCRPRDD